MDTEAEIPSQEWLNHYEKIKHILTPLCNLGELYELEEAFGKRLFLLDMGEVYFPTGEILVRDPLMFLNEKEKPYFQKVPIGRFPLSTLVIEIEKEYYRYASSRVKFLDKKAIYYREALIGNENINTDLKRGDIFGFFVDTGLATIVDIKTRDAFIEFEQQWKKENPNNNIYDDLLAEQFKKNAQKNPKFQRENGDWINFQIPNTDLSIPMIQSGFGDGQYPVYFGFDENNNICEVIVEFIDLGLAFGE